MLTNYSFWDVFSVTNQFFTPVGCLTILFSVDTNYQDLAYTTQVKGSVPQHCSLQRPVPSLWPPPILLASRLSIWGSMNLSCPITCSLNSGSYFTYISYKGYHEWPDEEERGCGSEGSPVQGLLSLWGWGVPPSLVDGFTSPEPL
jgi:hypothetical protein